MIFKNFIKNVFSNLYAKDRLFNKWGYNRFSNQFEKENKEIKYLTLYIKSFEKV